MSDGIRIDALPPTSSPNVGHEIPAMLGGITNKLTLQQIVDLAATGGVPKLPLAGGTLTGNLTLSYNAPTIALNKTAGQGSPLVWQTGGNARWQWLSTNEAEAGAQAGSNMQLVRFNDAGAQAGIPIKVNRATGVVDFENSPTVAGAPIVGTSYLPLAGGTLTGKLTARYVSPQIQIDKTAIGQSSFLSFTTNNSARWSVYTDAESGSGNGGGNLIFLPASDAGAGIPANQVLINRATGQLSAKAIASAGALTAAGNTSLSGALDVNGLAAFYNACPLMPQVQIASAVSSNITQVGITTGYELRKFSTSSRLVKQDIVPLDDAVAIDFIEQAQAVSFKYRPDKVEAPDRPFYGFISEDLFEIGEQFSRNEGEDRVPDDRAIMAALVRAVQLLTERVAVLEEAAS